MAMTSDCSSGAGTWMFTCVQTGALRTRTRPSGSPLGLEVPVSGLSVTLGQGHTCRLETSREPSAGPRRGGRPRLREGLRTPPAAHAPPQAPGKGPGRPRHLKLVHHPADPAPLLPDDVPVKVKGHIHLNGDRDQRLQEEGRSHATGPAPAVHRPSARFPLDGGGRCPRQWTPRQSELPGPEHEQTKRNPTSPEQNVRPVGSGSADAEAPPPPGLTEVTGTWHCLHHQLLPGAHSGAECGTALNSSVALSQSPQA